MQQRVIPVRGMHCHSCELLIKEQLEKVPGVVTARASVKSNKVTITLEKVVSQQALADAIAAAGYSVGSEKKRFVTRDKKVYRDVGIGLLLVVVVALIWSYGQWDVWSASLLSGGDSSTGTTALIVGLTAGFSTCMALVGGLVLGISAKYAERYPSATTGQRLRPHIFFNIGRIVGFTVFGALIGAVGAFFSLNGTLLGWLLLLVSVVMLLLGLNLTELFPRLTTVTLPSKLAERMGIKKGEREYAWYRALTTGVFTFFLPCGFTQAIQLTAIASGSPWTGALIMGLFALGTTPGLLGIGGLGSSIRGRQAKTIFRLVGVGLVAMALVNAASAVTLANIRLPEFRSQSSVVLEDGTKRLDATYTPSVTADIQPQYFTTQVGQRTALVVEATDDGQGCMSTIMIPGLYDAPILIQKNKRIVLEFTPKNPGVYQITCAMGISRGTITVEG